jgi:hypothetical protein
MHRRHWLGRLGREQYRVWWVQWRMDLSAWEAQMNGHFTLSLLLSKWTIAHRVERLNIERTLVFRIGDVKLWRAIEQWFHPNDVTRGIPMQIQSRVVVDCQFSFPKEEVCLHFHKSLTSKWTAFIGSWKSAKG